MSLATAGIDCTVSPPLLGAMEDYIMCHSYIIRVCVHVCVTFCVLCYACISCGSSFKFFSYLVMFVYCIVVAAATVVDLFYV